jgi:hypothetical protein
MYYFLTASKDATLYNQSNFNTGLDEILEVSKIYSNNQISIARSLLYFDFNPISASIQSNDIILSDVRLILRETESNMVGTDFTIEVYPVSQSWEMGIGTKYGELSADGVTWFNRDGESNTLWLDSYDGFEYNTTGSYYGFGGTFYSNYHNIQNFKYETVDINIDITDIVVDWISGSIPNDGIIIKYPFELEDDLLSYGNLKFFSKETKTIYQPKVQISWDDQVFSTGSLLTIPEGDMVVNFINLKNEYRVNSIPIIRLSGRELYPVKEFDTSFRYSLNKYLPETTYYEVRDYISNDIIIPFSEYSKVSCDGQSNFIRLNLSNWEINRTYSIKIKVVRNSNDYYFDGNFIFKVVE